MDSNTRLEINREPRNGHSSLRSTVAWVFIFLLFLSSSAIKLQGHFEDELREFHLNLSTEILGVIAGAGLSALVIDRIYAYRNRKDLQRRLVREAGSRSHDIAMSAVEWLRREGWLTGENGLLEGQNLYESDLRRVKLDGANLRGAKLGGARLRSATLNKAQLQRSELRGADLRCAKLVGARLDYSKMYRSKLQESKLFAANLTGANLAKAELQNARLGGANLTGAHLHWCNLSGISLDILEFMNLETYDSDVINTQFHLASRPYTTEAGQVKFEGAVFLGAHLEGAIVENADFNGAILPDGKDYSKDTDMARFTDPTHPGFAKTLDKITKLRKELGFDD